ncbi:hypothetical protein [Streptomyces thioluteus]
MDLVREDDGEGLAVLAVPGGRVVPVAGRRAPRAGGRGARLGG